MESGKEEGKVNQRKLFGIAWLLVTFLLAGSLFAFAGVVYAFDPDTDLSNADASFWGEDAGDHSGYSVASAGDVNGDGRDDFLIGAYADEDGGVYAGQTYLLLGTFDLTISSTSGGTVTVPGVETYSYKKGTVVDLVADAEEGYQFVNWTGDVGTIANVIAAATNITMTDNHSIMANFKEIPTVTPSERIECCPESPCAVATPECQTETLGGGLLWSVLGTAYIMGRAVGDVTEHIAGTLGCWVDELGAPTFGGIGVLTEGLGGLISGVGDLIGMSDIFDPLGEMLSAIGNVIEDLLPS